MTYLHSAANWLNSSNSRCTLCKAASSGPVGAGTKSLIPPSGLVYADNWKSNDTLDWSSKNSSEIARPIGLYLAVDLLVDL